MVKAISQTTSGEAQKRIDPNKPPQIQEHSVNTRIRVNVTTCLYLNPKDRAISLSTLIAVDVRTDTPHNKTLKAEFTSPMKVLIFSFILSVMKVAWSGWEARPTQRSVTARHRNKSFVGGWREVTLGRTIRIKILPKEAVMDRKMFETERNTTMPVGHVVAFVWSGLLE